MHNIEPFYNWENIYRSSKDTKSPFYGKKYSDTVCHNTIYNHYIHPQWDEFGSQTLYIKILFVDYEKHYAIIELLGEWNDTLYNDIMFLYRNVIETLLDKGITYFILIGENVLDFHSDTDDYYAEWFDNLDSDGWIAALNFRNHVINEFSEANIDHYFVFGGQFDELPWRNLQPYQLFKLIDESITKRLGF